MIVLKFGGTSVADADADSADLEHRRHAARSRTDRRRLRARRRDQLAARARRAGGARTPARRARRARGASRPAPAARPNGCSATGRARVETCEELSAMVDELAHLAEALSTLGDVTPRSLDAIASFGERMSSLLVRRGLSATRSARGSRRRLRRDDHRRRLHARRAAARRDRGLVPRVSSSRCCATDRSRCSAVSSARRRERESSPRSDAAAATTARRSSAPPSAPTRSRSGPTSTECSPPTRASFRSARLIDQIAFDEASELASFGAKVLHPNTIAPAVRLGIPVYVLNSMKPQGHGTKITFDAPRRSVSAIAGKSGRDPRARRFAAHAAHGRVSAVDLRDRSSGTRPRWTSSRRRRCRCR